MTSAVLELNDNTINLYQDGDLVSSSPGFALSLGGSIQFGQSAAEQSRLHPVNTHNEFWYRLSMAPLTRPLAHFRNNADVVHAHLQHIAQASDFEGDVTIAVPGSFSREQLAILGGVVAQTPFRAAAMMDAGLFYAKSHMADHSRVVFADMQLHQFSLTLLSQDQHQLKREQAVVVQGAGWSNIANALVQVINDAFIQQSRFNPQHSAFWEQHLYNELPDYLLQIRGGQADFLVSITTDKTTHQARVSVAEMVDSLQPVFRRITQQLQALSALSSDGPLPVLISERAAAIPGLEATLQVQQAPLSGENMANACSHASATLTRTGTDVPFISSWRISPASVNNTADAVPVIPERVAASHILLDGIAYPLRSSIYVRASTGATVSLNDAASAEDLCVLAPAVEGIVIKSASASVLINAKAATPGQTLSAGDQLSVGDDPVLQLIRVHDGRA
ncbi:hypothetical protein PHACT_08545 [Pseudohongiella acticola]|uniref:FHA domain-containing protein n=1 Tax=Pseudohongiella acticola TaxID=1524254 RepID=A0A1E8CL98_9GAMM|nr:hypothetical protein [Pseudohongiella acticola]OFE13183.1 hypothetical protein PHACT_08545 [Pseudohongiella acticola]